MKKTKIGLAILSLPLALLITSCGSAKAEYTIISGEQSKEHLEVITDASFKTEYKSGDRFEEAGLRVVFDGAELTRAVEGTPSASQYYITTSKSDPIAAAFGKDASITVSKRHQKVSFYVAYSTTDEAQKDLVYISDPLVCNVTNPAAADQWVVYLVLGIAIVAIGVYTTLRQKRIRDNKKASKRVEKPSPLDEKDGNDKKEEELESENTEADDGEV